MIVKTCNGVVVIEKNNDITLFDPETFMVFYPKENGSYEESISSFLEKKSIIKQKNSSQDTPLFQATSTIKKRLSIYWLVTNNCNLRCSYCFADGGSYGQTRGYMEEKTIEQMLSLLNKDFSDVDEFRILFFGGEPCLYPKVMEMTALAAKDILKGKKLILSGTTNGTILPEKLQSFLEENNVKFAVSLDGQKCVQNCLRKTATGIGSYDLVRKNLKNFKLISKKLPILVTVTPKNMELTKTYLHLKELGASYIRFTPATLPSDSSLCFTDNDIAFLKNELTNLADIYLKDLLTEEHPVEIESFSIIKSIFHNQKRRTYCGLGDGIIAVTPQGDLYPCPHFIGEKRHCLGNVHSTFDKEAFKNYFHENQLGKKPTCNACPVKNLCGGECYNYLDNRDKGPNDMSSILCEIFKHQAYLSIWMYAKLYKAGFFAKNINKPCNIENTVKSKTIVEEQAC
ncbi:MAG: radical SAM protein [Candidatus Babeliales bacterium]|jgi:uncharacterized protein|nr:MAG: Quinohemoprotein amine dehydrogenase, maturation protein, radical SAM superfamily [candidate division TM6 bacterium GW2011_GWF2_36_6]